MPDKKDFYSKLYIKDITDKHFIHPQKVFEEYNIKNLGEYQSDTLLFPNVFENFRNKCIEIYYQIFCTLINKLSGIIMTQTFKMLIHYIINHKI